MGQKYRFKTTPYRHQRKAIRKLLRNGYGGALLMEPRTGKTKSTVDYMSILNQTKGLRKVLVVCPAKVMGVWLQEIMAHSPRLCNVIIWDAEGRKRIQLPTRTDPYDMTIVVVNFEAFSTPSPKTPSGKPSAKGGRLKHISLIKRWLDGDPALCVIDESHKIKSPSGKAARALVNMHHVFKWRVILTGTPVTKAKRAHDIYMQWKFLNPERFKDIGNADEFKHHYGRWLAQDHYERWIGPRNHDELQSRILKDAFIVRRDECFDLPPREDMIEYVTLKRETARVYDDMAQTMVAKIENGEIVEASAAIVVGLRLAQITAGMAHTEEGGKHRIGSEKLDALRPHLEDAVERDEKIVLCGRFKADLDAMGALCGELGLRYWELRGGIPRAVTDTNIRQFKEWDEAGAFIMQPQAGSLGIDLRTAHKMIWLSLTSSFVDFSQACDRIALSNRSTTFVYILAEGTIDQVMYDALQDDGDVARRILTRPETLLRKKGNK